MASHFTTGASLITSSFKQEKTVCLDCYNEKLIKWDNWLVQKQGGGNDVSSSISYSFLRSEWQIISSNLTLSWASFFFTLTPCMSSFYYIHESSVSFFHLSYQLHSQNLLSNMSYLLSTDEKVISGSPLQLSLNGTKQEGWWIVDLIYLNIYELLCKQNVN